MTEGVLDKVLRNKSFLQIKTLGMPEQTLKTLVSENVKVATETDWKTITEAGLEAITQETLKQL